MTEDAVLAKTVLLLIGILSGFIKVGATFCLEVPRGA